MKSERSPSVPQSRQPADPTAALPQCPERTRDSVPTAPPSRVDKETQPEEPVYDDMSDLSVAIKQLFVYNQPYSPQKRAGRRQCANTSDDPRPPQPAHLEG